MTNKPIKIAKSKQTRVKNFKDFNQSFLTNLANSKKDQKLYLQLALEEFEEKGNLPNFLLALRNIAIAKGGIAELSKKTNLNRQSLYKALSAQGNPGLFTIDIILRALGFKLMIKSI